jgi:DNA-binding transcriptional ArsR family regulator
MDAADVHLLLSDKNRRRILELVLAGSPTVTDLVRTTRLRQPLVSHHLAALRAAGAVVSVREGRFRRYQPASAEVVKALAGLASAAEAFVNAAASAAEVEEGGKPAKKPAGRLRR